MDAMLAIIGLHKCTSMTKSIPNKLIVAPLTLS